MANILLENAAAWGKMKKGLVSDIKSASRRAITETVLENARRAVLQEHATLGATSASNVAIINKVNVNIPQHQLATVKAILASPEAMASIAKGEAGFTIETYKTTDTYYKIHFVDIEPGTIDEDYELGDFAE